LNAVAQLFADARLSVRECDRYLAADAATEAVVADFGKLSAEESAWLRSAVEQALQTIEDARELGASLFPPTLMER
jgi:uncharacterized protein (DUF433 family)